MAVFHPGIQLWLAAFVFISNSRACYVDVEEWQGRCVYDGRKGFGRGATCRAAGHGALRGDTRKSSTKQCMQFGLAEGAKNSGGKRRREPRTTSMGTGNADLEDRSNVCCFENCESHKIGPV